MTNSSEWSLHLGPLDFSIGIRAIQLSDAFRELDPSYPGADTAAPRPLADPRVVGRMRLVDESVLAWESEGGSVN